MNHISVDRVTHGNHVLHHHEFYELIIIESGKGYHLFEENTAPVRSGDVFLIPIGIKHGYSTTEELTIRNILFTDHIIQKADARLYSFTGVQALLNRNHESRCRGIDGYRLNLDTKQLLHAVSLADEIEKELNQKKSGYHLVVSGLLVQLIVFLCRCYESPGWNLSNWPIKISQAIAYMEANSSEKIDLVYVANYLGMSPRTFYRRFKTATGTSPARYLQQCRLKQAKHLLSQGRSSITEIAHACGFCDSSHFCQAFRKEEGISPREYKKTYAAGLFFRNWGEKAGKQV